jgi:hypothetical protein
MRSMVEGYLHCILLLRPRESTCAPLHPATLWRGPPPRSGEVRLAVAFHLFFLSISRSCRYLPVGLSVRWLQPAEQQRCVVFDGAVQIIRRLVHRAVKERLVHAFR